MGISQTTPTDGQLLGRACTRLPPERRKRPCGHGRRVHPHGSAGRLRRRHALDRDGSHLGVLDAGRLCLARSRIHSGQERGQHHDEEPDGLLRRLSCVLDRRLRAHVRQEQWSLWQHGLSSLRLRKPGRNLLVLPLSDRVLRHRSNYCLGRHGRANSLRRLPGSELGPDRGHLPRFRGVGLGRPIRRRRMARSARRGLVGPTGVASFSRFRRFHRGPQPRRLGRPRGGSFPGSPASGASTPEANRAPC